MLCELICRAKTLRRGAADRLGVRRRPVRGRPQLDRDRLHLPGGDAGMARLGRGRPAVALSRRLSGARDRPRAGGSDATNRVALLLVLGGAWAITEWLRGTMFTGFPWNPAAAVLVPTPLIAISAADRHLRAVGPGRAARRRDLARILPPLAAAGGDPRRHRVAVAAALLAGARRPADGPQRSASSSPTSARRTSGAPGFDEEAARRLATLSGPPDRRAAPPAVAGSRGHRSARGRAHRRASGDGRSSSAPAPPRCSGPTTGC